MKKLSGISKSWLFTVPDRERTPSEIILWWESRRIPYNLIVGLFGLISLGIIALIEINSPYAMGTSFPLLCIIFFGLGANVFYTGGWIVELLARGISKEPSRNSGPQLLLAGLVFSVLLDFIPLIFFIADLCWRAWHHQHI
jgi:hypothetical protein